jgi:methionyl aminopeptidase
MAITIKTPEDIEMLREGGKRHAFILKELALMVRPGISTKEIDDRAHALCVEQGDQPSFLNYKPYGARRAYPASVCISVNDAIVHGIPNENPIVLKEGDIVSLDMGVTHKGLITDAAITVPVGAVSSEAKSLLSFTKKALDVGLNACRAGGTTGDIGAAIEDIANKHGYGIVRELAGHGVGYKVHEDPYVPNYGKKGEGAKLKVGMVIAIEPMFNIGGDDITLDDDGYTYRTADGSLSAHFEHTVVVTEKGCEILTK